MKRFHTFFTILLIFFMLPLSGIILENVFHFLAFEHFSIFETHHHQQNNQHHKQSHTCNIKPVFRLLFMPSPTKLSPQKRLTVIASKITTEPPRLLSGYGENLLKPPRS
ncbi:MAG: hypothetical protein PF689_06045 [Deltaproteobacteria bacterium]|nr:hypothetical protein [Deltaproteobacteria bacterium]